MSRITYYSTDLKCPQDLVLLRDNMILAYTSRAAPATRTDAWPIYRGCHGRALPAHCSTQQGQNCRGTSQNLKHSFYRDIKQKIRSMPYTEKRNTTTGTILVLFPAPTFLKVQCGGSVLRTSSSLICQLRKRHLFPARRHPQRWLIKTFSLK